MPEHYFTKKPTSVLRKHIVSFSFHGKELTFTCASGVFSAKHIDPATQLLLENATIHDDLDVLDLGCGIGVIGISIKKAYPSCIVVLSDVNKRALQFAALNAKQNKVEVNVVESDLYAAFSGKQFDTVITNPPLHAGRKLVYLLIEEAPLHLKSGGLLQLVAKHQKGGAMLEKKMNEVFGNVTVLAKKSGFRVYCSRKE
jgi:16S rRNA G1207 methylase RsmC